MARWGAANSVSTEVPKPERVPGLTNIVHVARSCALDNDGKIWCWGTGPLLRSTVRGYTTVGASAPVQIAVPAATRMDVEYALNSSRAAPAAVGCAVAVSGNVYCWGSNASGQAGDDTYDYALTPVKVKGLPGPASVVRTSTYTTCALLTTGKVYCWGDNPNGELGNGTIQDPTLVPVQVLLPE
ncbi:BNR repeat domain protein [Labilithrix luteola]|uniref:BNR repeat domain protein n=1 Tax=Labilithrix luteola TaxID=1391654 RepID=A0A0K1PWE1_9BACT|nr:hypothetical protein [Labilithrix luteola]AKU97838.1 BNR repeat domain protein [Labilithrix luteola]